MCTWGEPRGWRYARYVSDDKSVRDFSTLGILCERERPAKVIVVALDTLADPKIAQKADSFGKIEEPVRSYVAQFLCGACKEADVEVHVLPGILERREEGRRVIFESNPGSEFLPLLTKLLVEKGLEVRAKLGVDVTDLVLDVSHGVNFMPVLAMRAAEEAAAALAAAEAKPVRLRVYQSDPYPLGLQGPARSGENVCKPERVDGEPTLRYNRILEKTLEPWSLSRYTAYASNQASKALTDTRNCKLREEEARDLLERWCLPILGAFRLGALLQLALLAKAAPLDGIKCTIERAVKCWKDKRGTQSADSSNDVKVASGTRFASGFWALVHARAVVEGARGLLGFGGPRVELEAATASLSELNKLKELLRGSRVVRELANREISKLDKIEKSGCVPSDRWVLYSDVQRERGEPAGGKGDTFERDFIAHAGFHSDVVELRMEESRLLMRVKVDEWERVKEVLRKAVYESA